MPDPESSTGSEVVSDATIASTPDVAAVESSPAEQSSGEPTSTLEAVKAALHPAEDPDDASPASKTPGPTDTAASPDQPGEQPPADELSEAERAQLKGRTRKSFERLTSRVGDLTKEVETLRGRTAEYDRMLDYIKSTKLSPQDLDVGFEIMSLMKQGNPHEAWNRLAPVVQQLQRMIGLELPADLQEQVRQGYLTEGHARELAVTRSAATHATAREQARQRESEEAARQRAIQDLVTSAAQAAETWEQQKQTADPDWNRKSARVLELAELEVYKKGYPQSAAAVVQMLNGIYDKVTSEIRSFQPRAGAVRPPAAGQSSSRTVAEPKSMLEAVRLGVRGAA